MDTVVERVVGLYEENEKRAYSDGPKEDDGAARGYEDLKLCIGFVDHALQAAKQAADAKADEETIVAALLHDIGWLVPKPNDSSLLTTSDESVWLAKHDAVGGCELRSLGFSDRLSRLVEGHVQAKRYLTYKVDGYYEDLSAGSKFTLKHQGGIMTADEAEAFERDPDFEVMCRMRRWDEGAKVVGLVTPPMRSYSDAIKRCLRSALWADRRGYTAAAFVTASLVHQIQEVGYVVIRNWMTASEIATLPAYCKEVEALEPGSSAPGPFHMYERAKDNDRVLARTECFCDAPDANGVGSFLKYGRLKQICEMLRGGRKQTLLKEKINYKFAGAGGYVPHQDGYWQIANLETDVAPHKVTGEGDVDQSPTCRTRLMKDEEVCVCMVAVDHSDKSNGCPAVAPGWHNKGWLGLNAPDDPVPIDTPCTAADMEWRHVELFPGDALIYGNNMPHMSEANTSDRDRRALFAIYGDVERLGEDIRERYYLHEANNRRAKGMSATQGKANRYFTGEAVMVAEADR